MQLFSPALSLLNKIRNAGVVDPNQPGRRPIQYINTLAFLGSMLVFILGGVFYGLVKSIYILMPLVLEGFGMLAVIACNWRREYNKANFLMFAIHYIAAGYWTTLLGNAIPIEVVISFLLIFLTCGSFLVYTAKRIRVYSLLSIGVLLIAIQCNTYFRWIAPIPLEPQAAFTMRLCTTGGMLSFILFVIYAFVREIDILLHSLRQSNSVLIANAAFLRETFHELRTPLNSIFGAAQLLDIQIQERADNPVVKDIAPEIRNVLGSGLLAKEIIDNVLDFKKIEAGKFYEIKAEKMNLQQSMEQCIRMNQYVANLRGISIRLDYQLPSAGGICDEIIFKKIFNNLLSNAVKFAADKSEILITATPTSNGGSFSIQNQGTVSQDKINTMFLPFESERNNFMEGTGIGLHLTQQLIELLNGRIIVSCDGKDTIFTFHLPFESCQINRSKVEAMGVNPTEFAGIRAVIVDDNEMNQHILQKFVSRTGANTVVCANGQEGLDATISGKPDIIISDAHMPIMDGKQMLEQIRQIPGLQEVPIIIVSGDAFNNYNADESEIMLKAGANAYLKKPVSFRELYNVMKLHLPKKSPVPENQD
ncbi:MAG: response regulator [Chitinophaga sp.]|uniref:ATP-binding response regulator n=1 Tax=Chitinophaga sp. TaxID=1869181 RepID=UPI0025B9AE70|nr:hybrid sensor histidine kinase/response regulator [Chitinophaga sp.]MBV8252126.1 response regulator [Chitinophaga sp.]